MGITAFLLNLSATTIIWVTSIGLLFYTLIPLTVSVYLLNTNKITSFDLPERKSRHLLFGSSIAGAFAVSLILGLTAGDTSPMIFMISLVFLINTSIGLLINLLWKISIHSAALSSAAAIFLFLFAFQGTTVSPESLILSLTILLLLLPLMIWARYRLQVHSLAELLGGTLTGFLLTIIELSIFTRLW